MLLLLLLLLLLLQSFAKEKLFYLILSQEGEWSTVRPLEYNEKTSEVLYNKSIYQVSGISIRFRAYNKYAVIGSNPCMSLQKAWLN